MPHEIDSNDEREIASVLQKCQANLEIVRIFPFFFSLSFTQPKKKKKKKFFFPFCKTAQASPF